MTYFHNYVPAGSARLSLYEEAEKVEDHEHDMIVQEGWVNRLWYEQDWDQPLEAVHQAAVVAEPSARQQPSTLDDDPAVVVCNSDFWKNLVVKSTVQLTT